ncbi:MAG: DUF563 domain-containing protein [Oscillatoriales cyanobacterium RM2_1_1]|nr:DUF563 domain-containing protein [Oscillatoriales cyanobacterium RM2_1_1]
MFQALQQLDQAIPCYQQGIDADPTRLSVYHKLGKVLNQLEQWEKALNVFQMGIELNPNFSWFYNGLGRAFMGLEAWEKAAIAYQKSIELNPNFFWSSYHLLKILTQLKQWQAVTEVCHHLIGLNPDLDQTCLDQIYLDLGNALIQLRDYDSGILAYRQGLKLNPSLEEFYSRLGGVLFKLGRWQQAAEVYGQVANLKPDHWWYPYLRGEALANTRNWQCAAPDYYQVIQLYPENAWSYHQLGEIFERQGESMAAIDIYKQVLQLTAASQNFSYYLAQGKIQALQDQPELAIKSFVHGLQINPDAYGTYGKIAQILNSIGRQQDGILCRIHQEFSQNFIADFLDFDQAHIATVETEIGLQKLSLYPPESLELSPPKMLVPGQFHTIFSTPVVQAQNAFVAIIPDGIAWGSQFVSAIFTVDHHLIPDLSTGAASIIAVSNDLPQPQIIQGTTAFLSVKWGLMYYHWIFDIIARFALLEQSIGLENIDNFVVNSTSQSYERETLELLGIPLEKVIESQTIPHIATDQLVVPSPLKNFKHSSWSCKFLRENLLLKITCAEFNPWEKIYISRSLTSKRRVINEIEVVHSLEKYGFKKVNLEPLSVRQQICCLANARVIVAPHGGGLTSLIFCQPGTLLVEFLAATWPSECYWLLSNACNLEYYQLICDSVESPLSDDDGRGDLYVKINELLQILELANAL